ncbi:MAG: LytR/AlgR family response regulator transcription factor, partial [Clostridium sp.]
IIEKSIKNAIAKNDYPFRIKLSSPSPQEILSNVEGNDIYFLDVDLNNKINGFKLAESIRKLDASGYIIFVTTHSELTYLTFKYRVEAMDYILKDNVSEIDTRISNCLEDIYKKYNSDESNSKILTLNLDDRVVKIALNDIIFIETSTNSHKVIIHEKNKSTEIFTTLKDISDKLDERFYRCHRAYIVNKEKIKEINKVDRVVYMNTGAECLASFRLIKGLL